MKTHLFIIALAILVIAMFTTCTDDPLDLKEIEGQQEPANQELNENPDEWNKSELNRQGILSVESEKEKASNSNDGFTMNNSPLSLAKGGKKGKPGGGKQLYKATYGGSLFSEVGVYGKARVNKVSSMLGGHCTMEMGSIKDFVGNNPLFAGIDCFTDDLVFCSPYYEIRQWDKRKNPSAVAIHFQFYDFDKYFINLIHLTFFGTIDNQIGGKYTIFPESGEEVKIILNEWRLQGSDCEQADFTDLPDGNTITIRPDDPNDPIVCPTPCPVILE